MKLNKAICFPVQAARLQLSRRLSSLVTDPLNILFFGSDQFSIHSLKGINKLKQTNPIVRKIQLVTRPPKWCGRKGSILKFPPIVEAAKNMGLEPPLLYDSGQDLLELRKLVKEEKYNMIIAVSFGKLIPAKLIDDVKYSLNVHPSLLPRYKGASPIQYALLNQDQYTGVTVQTLHPSKFDQGSIIAETDPISIDKMLLKGTTSEFESNFPIKTAVLMDQLGIEGSNLLNRVISEGLYQEQDKFTNDIKPSDAPKITTEMKHVNWGTDGARYLRNKLEILGPLFTHKEVIIKPRKIVTRRVIFHDFEVTSQAPEEVENPGDFSFDQDNATIFVKCKDNEYLKVNKIQFEGFKPENSKQFITSLRKRCGTEMSHQKTFL